MSGSSLVGALWYLRLTSLVGLIRSRLKRLKQPKYLAGAVVGLLYFYLVFFRRAHQARIGQGPGGATTPAEALPPDVLPLLAQLGAFVLLVVLALNWLLPRRAALPFSEPEIAFLFPAPVSRRMLVHYRLLSAQLGIAFTALVFTVVFGRGRGFGGHDVFQFVGWWLVLAMLNLHFMGTSFFYSRLLNRSVTTARRRAITIGVGVAILLTLVTWIVVSMRLPTDADVVSAEQVARYATDMLHAGPMPWLLALPRLALAPYFATSAGEFALALIPALVLLVAHYFWVVHTEVSFEEASIARAEKRAARKRAHQEGDWRGHVGVHKRISPPFVLGGRGAPELAFLWKNLIATGPLARPVPIAVLAVILGLGAAWLAHRPELEAISAGALLVSLTMLVFAVLLGPQIVRQDLRTDLANSDLLKTYPLRGWQIVLGEMLAPVCLLTVVVWILLSTSVVSFPDKSTGWLTPALRLEGALALAVLAPPFIALQVLIPNATAVLFPAWVQATRDRTERGVEVMGQRLIFIASQLLVTALALLPVLIIGSVMFFAVNLVAGPIAGGVMATLSMAVLLASEVWLGIQWLGTRFEKLDISSELRA